MFLSEDVFAFHKKVHKFKLEFPRTAVSLALFESFQLNVRLGLNLFSFEINEYKKLNAEMFAEREGNCVIMWC